MGANEERVKAQTKRKKAEDDKRRAQLARLDKNKSRDGDPTTSRRKQWGGASQVLVPFLTFTL